MGSKEFVKWDIGVCVPLFSSASSPTLFFFFLSLHLKGVKKIRRTPRNVKATSSVHSYLLFPHPLCSISNNYVEKSFP